MRLLIHGYCVFDVAPDDTKIDFIEALEIRGKTLIGNGGAESQGDI